MAYVYNFFKGILKSIPVILAKIGTMLLFIFTLGLFAGYLIAVLHISPLLLAVPVISMFVMWYRLDEGFLLLVILAAIIIFFPQVVGSIVKVLA
jgi:hypothetical protein